LVKPVDIFDLLMHLFPFVLLALKILPRKRRDR